MKFHLVIKIKIPTIKTFFMLSSAELNMKKVFYNLGASFIRAKQYTLFGSMIKSFIASNFLCNYNCTISAKEIFRATAMEQSTL